VASELRHGSGG